MPTDCGGAKGEFQGKEWHASYPQFLTQTDIPARDRDRRPDDVHAEVLAGDGIGRKPLTD